MREAKEIAADINAADTWEPELCAELCEAAGMTAEWEAAGRTTLSASCSMQPKSWASKSSDQQHDKGPVNRDLRHRAFSLYFFSLTAVPMEYV